MKHLPPEDECVRDLREHLAAAPTAIVEDAANEVANTNAPE